MTTSADVSIVIPTVTGREKWLDRCARAYELQCPKAQIIVIKDEKSCGIAWQKGCELSDRKYVHFTADDILPGSDWVREAAQCLDNGSIPAATVVDSRGRLAVCDSPLGDMGLWPNVLVPLLTQDLLSSGEWLAPIHYGSDDWVTYTAVRRGFQVTRLTTYRMTHYVAGEGRDYTRRHDDVALLAQMMEEAGYLPPVYRQLEINLRDSKTGLDNVSLKQLDMGQRDQLETQRRGRTWKVSP